jgi:hypothetical protein
MIDLVSPALSLRRRLVVFVADQRLREARRTLAIEKSAQRERFEALALSAPERYEAIREFHPPEFSVPDWLGHMRALEQEFSPAPPFDFLRAPRILFTMFILAGGRALRAQLAELQTGSTAMRLAELLDEEYVGDPVLMERRFRTSHQTIHHLYHLERFVSATTVNVAQLDKVVEWGAGYGNQARVFRRLHGGRPTQILIDLPLFSLLQWLYLSTVFAHEEVLLADSECAAICEGCINIVPVGLSQLVAADTDLFISTWAISEAARPAQDHVIDERDWFGARHLLLAHQRTTRSFPEAERVGQLAAAQEARVEPLRVMRGSRYAFR